MQLYRSYGRNGRVNGRNARQLFRKDHDLMLGELQGRLSSELPERVVFGLPHNYFFSSVRRKVDVNVKDNRRRASPLFIHVHEVEDANKNRRCVIVQTLLPTIFLPHELAVSIKPQGRIEHAIAADHVDYGVIQKYMREFK